MKILTLLRHAKSGWDDPVERDFDRPLNRRGRKAAQTVGAEMKRQGLAFDRILASPARRVVETLEEVARFYGAIGPDYDRRAYLASPAALLALVRGTGDDAGRLLLVGHNPGLERLALLLVRDDGDALRAELAIKYPTATVAEIGLPASSWSDVREGTGRLLRFIRPRDLDPELGPDAEGH